MHSTKHNNPDLKFFSILGSFYVFPVQTRFSPHLRHGKLVAMASETSMYGLHLQSENWVT
jgi:hypothetical protein